jgi:aryl-alcohol dehydrogenase-like predicted oxidoreductase
MGTDGTEYAIHNRLTPFVSMQNQHNALYREEEREMMPTLKHFGVGCIPWGPLSAGSKCLPPSIRSPTFPPHPCHLTHPLTTPGLCRPFAQAKATSRSHGQGHYNVENAHEQQIIDKVEDMAKRKGVKMAQIALAWSMACEFVTAPIVGTTSNERLDELVGALAVELSVEEKKELDDLYTPVKIRGHA